MIDDYDITEEKIAMWTHVESAFAGETNRGWMRKSCPNCEELEGRADYKLSLGYNPATGGFNCFKCGIKGSLPRNWRARLELLEPEERSAPVVEAEVEPAEGFMPLFEEPGLSASVFDAARDYLLRPKSEGGRELTPEIAAYMRVGATVRGLLWGRVIVPIPNYARPDLPWRGWVARDYTRQAALPYRYPKGMSREGLLFNESALWLPRPDPVFLVEGAFDTVRLLPDAVAGMGKPLASHLEKLRRSRRPVVVCLDGDAWEEGLALSWTLRHLGVTAGAIHLPARTDPDEMPEAWLREAGRKSLLES